MLLVRILYVDGDFVRKVEPELCEYLSWPAHQAPAVVGRAVPLGRVAEDRSRVAGAQRADDHVVQRWRVREDLERCEVAGCAESGGLHPVDTGLLTGRHRFGESQLLELGIQPCLGHQMRCGGWA